MIPTAIPKSKLKAGALIIPIKQPAEVKPIPKFVITPFYLDPGIPDIPPQIPALSIQHIFKREIVHKAS